MNKIALIFIVVALIVVFLAWYFLIRKPTVAVQAEHQLQFNFVHGYSSSLITTINLSAPTTMTFNIMVTFGAPNSVYNVKLISGFNNGGASIYTNSNGYGSVTVTTKQLAGSTQVILEVTGPGLPPTTQGGIYLQINAIAPKVPPLPTVEQINIAYDSGKTTCAYGVICCTEKNTTSCTTWKGATLGMYCYTAGKQTPLGTPIQYASACENIYSVTITTITNKIYVHAVNYVSTYGPPVNSLKYVMNLYCIGATTVLAKIITTIQPNPTTLTLPYITSANGIYCNSTRAVISVYSTTRVNYFSSKGASTQYTIIQTTYLGQITVNYPAVSNCTANVSTTEIYINGQLVPATTSPQNPIVAKIKNDNSPNSKWIVTTLYNTSWFNVLIQTPHGNQSLSYGADYFCVYNTTELPSSGYVEQLGFSVTKTTNSSGCKTFSQKVYHTTSISGKQCTYYFAWYTIGPTNVFVFFNYPS
jgi:hypothetical protein